MPKGSNTILGSLIQRNKEQHNKKLSQAESRQKNQKKQEPRSDQPEIRERSIDLLTKRLKIVSEAKQDHVDEQTTREVNKWLQSLNPTLLRFNKSATNNVFDHFDIDVQGFINKYLTERDNKVLQMDADNFELTPNQNDDLEIDEDYIETQLLNKKHFVEYEYKVKTRTSRYRTEMSIYDYSIKVESKFFDISQLLIKDPDVDMVKTHSVSTELFTLLQNFMDLSIVDAGGSNCDENVNTILYHIMSFCYAMNKINKENKDRLTGDDDKEVDLSQINGFVRPRVLVVLNYKYQFRDLASRLFSMCPTKVKPEVLERLETEFESEDTAFMNNFVIGVMFSHKSMQITHNLQHADVIFANPRFLIEKVSNRSSLLSSIEIIYMHKFSQFLMEDLSVITELFESVNQVPEHSHVDQDFRTIREVHSSHLSKFTRQAIYYSEFTSIELNAIISRYSLNYKGVLKTKVFYPKPTYGPNVTFLFKRLTVRSLSDEYEDRFNYFGTEIWADIRKNELYQNSILFVNSYLLYKRLQKYLKEKHSPVGFISEHTPKNKVQSNFARFNNGEYKYLLITERALHFKVCEPKRYKNVIFYNLPFNQETFDSLVGNMDDEKSNQLIVVFSRRDLFELERIIGTSKALEFMCDKNAYKSLEFN